MNKPSPTQRNIRAICELEKTALEKRSLSARVGDLIATEAGKMWFILFHVLWFVIWVALNLKSPANSNFDPFPFSLLTMIVSLESIFLSLFILMSQNRTGRQQEERNHLDLQINLLAEDENTKMIHMLHALCEHNKLSIANDPEILLMMQRTEVNEVISDLKDNLPN